MDSSAISPRVETMKPFLFKAGISLTLSLAAFAYARIASKRSNNNNISHNSAPETDHADSLGTGSQFGCDDHESFHSLSSPTRFGADSEEELISGLRDRIDDLQRRERELAEARESVVVRVDFLDNKLMEGESRRVERFVVEYLRGLEKLECRRSETELLRRQVKRLSRRTRVQSLLVRERDLRIRAKEEELLRVREALGASNNAAEMLEGELSELMIAFDKLQDERNELLNKLELEQRSTSSFSKIVEGEEIAMEEENRLANELESDAKELINLRWSNACLKLKLMKVEEQRGEQNHKNKEENWQMGLQAGHESDHGNYYENGDQACSSRKKFLKKLRKWVVEGCDQKGKENERERERKRERKGSELVQCFGRRSVHPTEHFQGRWSCSSF